MKLIAALALLLVLIIAVVNGATPKSFKGSAESSSHKILSNLDRLQNYRDATIQECVEFMKNAGSTERNFERKFNNHFINWVFTANLNGLLTDMLPSVAIISRDDIKWYLKRYAKGNNVNKRDIDLLIQRNQVTLDKSVAMDTKYSASYADGKLTVNGKEYPVTIRQMNRLEKIWKGTGNNHVFLLDVASVVCAYYILGGINNNLSIPIGLVDDIRDRQLAKGSNLIELFGSPLNTQYDYCSPFEHEKIFGSHGSFFDYELQDGYFYTCNPPYTVELMNQAATRLTNQLKSHKCTVVCVIPVWDSASQRELMMQDYGEPFPAFDTLINSKYFVDRRTMKKDSHKFYNYYDDSYVNAASTHMIYMSSDNQESDLNNIYAKWTGITKK